MHNYVRGARVKRKVQSLLTANLLIIYQRLTPQMSFIYKKDVNLVKFSQPLKNWLTEHAKALWDKMLRCDILYEKYILKDIINE